MLHPYLSGCNIPIQFYFKMFHLKINYKSKSPLCFFEDYIQTKLMKVVQFSHNNVFVIALLFFF